MNHIVASWWRWEISIQILWNKQIATKKAKHKSVKWAILKERTILQYLTKHWIAFTPKVISHTDDSFSYERIEWIHFHTAYKHADKNQKIKLILNLLEKAYHLDLAWVVHWEMKRPLKNMIVSPWWEVSIIDFERGEFNDFSGKNIRSLAQRLSSQWYLSVDQCKALGTMTLKIVYETVSNALRKQWKPPSFISQIISAMNIKKLLNNSPNNKWVYVIIATIIWLDLITKYLFYDLWLLQNLRLFTPILNTWIWRSIPIPIFIVTSISIAFVILLRRASQKKHLPAIPTAIILWWAIGNLYDRVSIHAVRDFIDFHVRPIFNLADIAITIWFILLLIAVYQDKE